MKGLLVKDFYSIKGYWKTVLFVFFVAGIPLFVNGSRSFGLGFLAGIGILLGGMMCFASFAADQTYRWDVYERTLPCTRRQAVLSKYIFSLLALLIGAGAGIGLSLVLAAAEGLRLDERSWIIIGTVGCLAVVFLAVSIPLMYRLGVEKARIAVVVILMVPFLVIGSVFLQNDSEQGWAAMEGTVRALLAVLPFLAAAALIVSYFISVRISGKREV